MQMAALVPQRFVAMSGVELVWRGLWAAGSLRVTDASSEAEHRLMITASGNSVPGVERHTGVLNLLDGLARSYSRRRPPSDKVDRTQACDLPASDCSISSICFTNSSARADIAAKPLMSPLR